MTSRSLLGLPSMVVRRIRRRTYNGSREPIADMCEKLLSARGEAAGIVLAADILHRYGELPEDKTSEFLSELARKFNPDPQEIVRAAIAHCDHGSADTLEALADVVEPPRQELFRRLNQAPGGTAELVRMRSDVLRRLDENAELAVIDNGLLRLLVSWFNRGFLTLRAITWSTSAEVLERIIDYEAVHEIGDWDELRRRLQPEDRRCFSFEHPAMADEPLIFVEVALTRGIPTDISKILSAQRESISAQEADTAVFYSISSCQDGLRGVSFGHFLIKQVARDLSRELPNISSFVTLSPAPGFRSWLTGAAADGNEEAQDLMGLSETGMQQADSERHGELIRKLGLEYLAKTKRDDGMPVDAVARFHLGNGAVLEQLSPQADTAGGSFGLMVNYRYDLDRIEDNHEAYTMGEVRISSKAR